MTGFPRSLLFVPADRPKMIESAFRSIADAIVFDLEDSIAMDRKDAARDAVRAILSEARALARHVFVRVNGPATAHGAADLRALAGAKCAGLVIPKIDTIDHVRAVVGEAGSAPLVLLLETPRGVLRALDLAEACGASLAAIAFGAEDFRAGMAVDPVVSDPVVAFARHAVVIAAAAAGVPAIDAPEMNLTDRELLRAHAARARAAGFAAKFAIHPSQLEIIHDAFAPSADLERWAERVTRAYEEGVAMGHGSVRVDDCVVDAVTIERARQILGGKRR